MPSSPISELFEFSLAKTNSTPAQTGSSINPTTEPEGAGGSSTGKAPSPFARGLAGLPAKPPVRFPTPSTNLFALPPTNPFKALADDGNGGLYNLQAEIMANARSKAKMRREAEAEAEATLARSLVPGAGHQFDASTRAAELKDNELDQDNEDINHYDGEELGDNDEDPDLDNDERRPEEPSGFGMGGSFDGRAMENPFLRDGTGAFVADTKPGGNEAGNNISNRAARSAGHRSGYGAGHRAGFAAGYDAGFRAGFEAGSGNRLAGKQAEVQEPKRKTARRS